MDFSHLQQHPTSSVQVLLDSATTNDVSANVSDVPPIPRLLATLLAAELSL